MPTYLTKNFRVTSSHVLTRAQRQQLDRIQCDAEGFAALDIRSWGGVRELPAQLAYFPEGCAVICSPIAPVEYTYTGEQGGRFSRFVAEREPRCYSPALRVRSGYKVVPADPYDSIPF